MPSRSVALGAAAAALGHGLIDASFALPDLMLVWVFLLHLFGPDTAKMAEQVCAKKG